MKKVFLLLIALSISVPALALDTSTETGKTQKEESEQSLQQKKIQEQKDTIGKKNTTTRSSGQDRTDSETIKAIGQAMSQSGADVTLPLEAVFLDRIAEMESTGQEPFASCKIASAPKLGRDFGLSAEVAPGVIDSIKSDYLAKAAQSNVNIQSIADEKEIRAYRDCLAQYGSIIAQAYLYLTTDLGGIKGSVSKAKNSTITVKGMGYDDFIALADTALQRASQAVTNHIIISMRDRVIHSQVPCQFDRNVENIKCGSALIILGTKPQLFVNGIGMYGDHFAGYSGAYKISKSWSYTDALEKLRTTNKYSKWAAEVQQYAEELESRGKTKEATMVRKKAWDIAKNNKQTVDAGQLLPPIH
ncbi:MAG: hypothetical protein ACLQF0_17020 [Dissulfurispiraceae bacterium]